MLSHLCLTGCMEASARMQLIHFPPGLTGFHVFTISIKLKYLSKSMSKYFRHFHKFCGTWANCKLLIQLCLDYQHSPHFKKMCCTVQNQVCAEFYKRQIAHWLSSSIRPAGSLQSFLASNWAMELLFSTSVSPFGLFHAPGCLCEWCNTKYRLILLQMCTGGGIVPKN